MPCLTFSPPPKRCTCFSSYWSKCLDAHVSLATAFKCLPFRICALGITLTSQLGPLGKGWTLFCYYLGFPDFLPLQITFKDTRKFEKGWRAAKGWGDIWLKWGPQRSTLFPRESPPVQRAWWDSQRREELLQWALAPFFPLPHSSSSSQDFFLRLWVSEASNLESEERAREPHRLSQLCFSSDLSKPQAVLPQHIHGKQAQPWRRCPAPLCHIHHKHHP